MGVTLDPLAAVLLNLSTARRFLEEGNVLLARAAVADSLDLLTRLTGPRGPDNLPPDDGRRGFINNARPRMYNDFKQRNAERRRLTR